MPTSPASLALESFQRAAQRVPAYRTLLEEAGVRPAAIRSLQDFGRLRFIPRRSRRGFITTPHWRS